jgi:hypothetical protein
MTARWKKTHTELLNETCSWPANRRNSSIACGWEHVILIITIWLLHIKAFLDIEISPKSMRHQILVYLSYVTSDLILRENSYIIIMLKIKMNTVLCFCYYPVALSTIWCTFLQPYPYELMCSYCKIKQSLITIFLRQSSQFMINQKH